jgi:hypothetical protein
MAARLLGFKSCVRLEDGMKELCAWSHGADAVDRVEAATAELAAHGLIV